MLNVGNCVGGGPGGYHARPGRMYCKHKKQEKGHIFFTGEDVGDRGELETNPFSPVSPQSIPWAAIIPVEELPNMPDREDPSYVDFCERVITGLKQRLSEAIEKEKVSKAKQSIADLMNQLFLAEGPSQKVHTSANQSPAPQSPGMGRAAAKGSAVDQSVPMQGASGSSDHFNYNQVPVLRVVEESDTKDYLSMLRPENHLMAKKSFENMNYIWTWY